MLSTLWSSLFFSEFLPASPHDSWSMMPKSGHRSVFKILSSTDDGGLFSQFLYRVLASASQCDPTYCFYWRMTWTLVHVTNCKSPRHPFPQNCYAWGIEGCCHKTVGPVEALGIVHWLYGGSALVAVVRTGIGSTMRVAQVRWERLCFGCGREELSNWPDIGGDQNSVYPFCQEFFPFIILLIAGGCSICWGAPERSGLLFPKQSHHPKCFESLLASSFES